MYVHSTFCYINFFSASGEAILGTQRYLYDANAILGTQRYLDDANTILGTQRYLDDANTILGTQRYFIKTLYTSTLSKHFTQALYQKHFTQALYQSTLHMRLSKHFTQALYQSTLSRYYNRVYQGITIAFIKVLQSRVSRYF